MSTLLLWLPLVVATAWLLIVPGLVLQLLMISRHPLSYRRGWLDTLFVSFLFSLCISSWSALILVEIGSFSATRVLGLSVLSCVGLFSLVGRPRWARMRNANRHLWGRADRWTWVMVLLVILACLLFFRPHEYILGGSDAGVYVNLGAHIARTGSLLYTDPDLAAIDRQDYPLLFRAQPDALIPRYIQFPGFFLSDERAGLVIPQFYPLHPIWLALFHQLGDGARTSLYLTPLWGVLGGLAVGLTTAALFGRRAGALALALLTFNGVQIWFARYPTSEALTQLLLFGGIYAFTHYARDESSEMGLLAGLALGQVMMVRVDTYFLLAIPLLWAGYLRLTRRLERGRWSPHLYFFLPFALMAVHSLIHGLRQSWPYLYNSYYFQIAGLPLGALIGAVGLALLGFVTLDGWVDGQSGRLAWLERWGRRAGTALAALVVLAALYGYFIRPQSADASATRANWYGGEQVPDVEPYNLVRLGWYLSPVGVALGVAGFAWMSYRDLNRRSALFLGVGLFFSFLYLQNSRNNPHHVYVMRRYMPAVVPAFSVATAYVLDHLWRRQGRWRWTAVGIGLLVLGLMVNAGSGLVQNVDYAGVLDQLTPWAEQFQPDDVILFDDDRPVSTGATIGTPLRYLYDHTVYDLQEQYLSQSRLHSLVAGWRAQGRRVLVAVGPDGVREPFADWVALPLPSLWLDAPVLESSYTHFPRKVVRSSLNVELYELQPASDSGAGRMPLRIDVGDSDQFYLGDGWHNRERMPDGTTIRWSAGNGELLLPDGAQSDASWLMRFRLASPGAPGSGSVSVFLRGPTGILARWEVGEAFATFTTRVPGFDLDSLSLPLWLEADAWTPASLGLGTDTRQLGVMVDWIEVEREP
jgi:hypothetical protein